MFTILAKKKTLSSADGPLFYIFPLPVPNIAVVGRAVDSDPQSHEPFWIRIRIKKINESRLAMPNRKK